ncbi:hypothetical protein IQ250_30025 [Pseudanabaenaceae cyanobacterium LEGE 13415]|nr:hypothetical protein [Pseudanabaenaceae cyanobacterium LEGE 13415]
MFSSLWNYNSRLRIRLDYSLREHGVRLCLSHGESVPCPSTWFKCGLCTSRRVRGKYKVRTSRTTCTGDRRTFSASRNSAGTARHIKANIFQETGLTTSAGVSKNKFLAKMASGMNKPNGLTVILPEQAESFTENLPIEKFHGIGRVTALKMRELGIHTGADLEQRSEAELVQQFGKIGRFYYGIARREDDRSVQANRIRKSVGADASFAEDLRALLRRYRKGRDIMIQELELIAQTLHQRLMAGIRQ